MAFPELLELCPPFVSKVWWLLYLCLVSLWFRQGFDTFFFFTLRRAFLLGLSQLFLRQSFEGFQDIGVQGLQAVLLPAFEMHYSRRLSSNIELEPLGEELLPEYLSIGALADNLEDNFCDIN